MTVLFGWKVLAINQSDIVMLIFFTLLGMTVVVSTRAIPTGYQASF